MQNARENIRITRTAHPTSQMPETLHPQLGGRVAVLCALRTRPVRKLIRDSRDIFVPKLLQHIGQLFPDIDVHPCHLGGPDLGQSQFVLLGVSFPEFWEDPFALDQLDATTGLQNSSQVAHNTKPLGFLQTPDQEALVDDVEVFIPAPAFGKLLEEVMLTKIEMGICQKQVGANVNSVQTELFLRVFAGQVKKPGS